ncbi:MAG: hypothetical protein EOO74_07400 [Myxococcales bacterium]|nr:MAG: hypothetical protein EOO74_07400 [Myxococcales bacterium]
MGRGMVGLSSLINQGDERCQRHLEGEVSGPVERCSYRRDTDGIFSRVRLPYVGLAGGFAF